MTFLAMPDRRRARNDLRYSSLLHVLAAATSRQWLLSFWWRVLCKYLVRLISVHILLHPFISFCVISFHFISFYVVSYHFMSYFKSFHVISYRFYQPHFIRHDGTMRNDTIWSLSGAQRQNCTICIHIYAFIILGGLIGKTSGFISINIIQYWICGDVTWHKWNWDILVHQD